MADGRRFGDGMAAGPDLEGAAEVAVGQALAPLEGARPDLLCVFVAPGAGHDPERAVAAGRRAMELGAARAAIGATASGVIGDGHGREHGPAVAAWAAVLPGARITPFRLEVTRVGDNLHVGGLPQPGVRRPRGGHARRPLHVPHRRRSSSAATPPRPGSRWSAAWPGPRAGRGQPPVLRRRRARAGRRRRGDRGGPRSAARARWSARAAGRSGRAMTVTRAERNLLLELAGQPAYRGWSRSSRRCRPPSRRWRRAACTSASRSTSTPTSTAAATSSSAACRAPTRTAGRWPSARSSRSGRPCGSRCATRRARGRT